MPVGLRALPPPATAPGSSHPRRRLLQLSTLCACETPISPDCRGFASRPRPRVGRFAAQFVFHWGYAMTVIREADVIAGVADALQYISYYHTPDFIRAMGRAYDLEQSPSARDAIAQILTNSRLCAEGHRPICQDTGIVVVFVKVGMRVRWEATLDLPAMINEGVRRAYLDPDNKLRASIVADPAFKRSNTRDNTPAVIHTEFGPGDTVEITVAAKGGGSENKSMFAMLNPSDSVADWVLERVPEMGAGWCPPGMLGVGIGGSAEKAMLLAKESLMEPIDIRDQIARGA